MTVLLASELTAADLALLARPEPARHPRERPVRRAPASALAEAATQDGALVQSARQPGHFARPAGRSASPLTPIRWFAVPAN